MNGAAFPSSTTTTTTSQSYNNTGSSRNIVPLNCSSLLLTNQAADDWIRTLQFPQKVYCLIEDGRYRDCLAWTPAGDSFVIKDQQLFTARILGSYFKQTKFSSFARQLNYFGFKRTRLRGKGIAMALPGYCAPSGRNSNANNVDDDDKHKGDGSQQDTGGFDNNRNSNNNISDNNNNNNNNNRNSSSSSSGQNNSLEANEVQLLTLANHLRSSTTTSSAGDSTDSETVAAANAIRKGELPTGYLILHPLFRRDRPDLLTGIVRRLNNEPLEVRGTAIATHRPDDHADSHPHAAGEPHQRSQRQHHRHHYQRKRKLELDNPLAEFESTVSLLKSTAKSFAAIENEWETRSDTSLVDDMDPRERVEQLTRSFSDILHNMRGVNLIISTQLQNQIKTLRETVDRRNETIEEMIRLVQNMPNSTTNQLYFNE